MCKDRLMEPNWKSYSRSKYLVLTSGEGCVLNKRFNEWCVGKIKLDHTFQGVPGRIGNGLNIESYAVMIIAKSMVSGARLPEFKSWFQSMCDLEH